MTVPVAKFLLNQIVSDFQNKYQLICGGDVPVLLKNDIPVGYCGSSDSLSEKQYMKIGIGGLCSSFLPFSRVSDEKFVQVLVSMFHENRHMTNCLNGYKDCRSDKTENLALSMCYLADQNNSFYYKGNHNYHMNLREIDAEHAGILDAYDYLCYQFPDKQADCEQLVLDYVNHKRELVLNGDIDYFFDNSCRRFECIDDIDVVFSQLFVDAMNKSRSYQFNRNTNDLAMSKFCQNNGWRLLHRKFLDSDSGFERDKMIGCIVLAVHPEYQNKIYDLRFVDFSPVNVFGCELPYDEEVYAVQQKFPDKDIGCTKCKSDIHHTRIMDLEDKFGGIDTVSDNDYGFGE